jgi:hypothetical protein
LIEEMLDCLLEALVDEVIQGSELIEESSILMEVAAVLAKDGKIRFPFALYSDT